MAGDTQEPWAIVRAKLSLAKTNPIAESHHYSQSSPASGSKRKVFYENIPALTIPSCWLFSSKQQNRPSDSGKNRAEATKKMAGSFFWKSGDWLLLLPICRTVLVDRRTENLQFIAGRSVRHLPSSAVSAIRPSRSYFENDKSCKLYS